MLTVLKDSKGSEIDLKKIPYNELERLHYDQELEFVKQILCTKPFSSERAQIMNAGYEFVHSLQSEMAGRDHKELELGASRYSIGLVLKTLHYYKKKHNKEKVCFFEGGVGTGKIIKAASKLTFVDVSGCDVNLSPVEELDKEVKLYQGTIFDVMNRLPDSSIDIFYWNDVMEHIPLDEISATLKTILNKLTKNGLLITITPNWHLRPTDVTLKFNPRGTEPKGFHFKEYKYQEISKLLKNIPFKRILTPYMINPFSKKYLIHFGMLSSLIHNMKYALEPFANGLPYFFKHCYIAMFAYNATIAEK